MATTLLNWILPENSLVSPRVGKFEFSDGAEVGENLPSWHCDRDGIPSKYDLNLSSLSVFPRVEKPVQMNLRYILPVEHVRTKRATLED